jgi:hypothetical protein
MATFPPGLLALTGVAVGVVVLMPGSRLALAETTHDHDPAAGHVLDVRAGATTELETGPLVPGDRDPRCFVLDYAGDSDAFVEVAADAHGTLTDHLDLTIETVAVDDADDPVACGSAPTIATILDGETLASFASATAAGDGLDAAWSPSGPERRTYRVTVTLQADDRAQGASGSAELRWQVHGR